MDAKVICITCQQEREPVCRCSKQQSKTHRIMSLLLENTAMRYTDIQKELWKMSYPDRPFTRAQRGYWCLNLIGCWKHRGILGVFARKGADGLWRANYNSVPSEPWSMIYRMGGLGRITKHTTI